MHLVHWNCTSKYGGCSCFFWGGMVWCGWTQRGTTPKSHADEDEDDAEDEEDEDDDDDDEEEEDRAMLFLLWHWHWHWHCLL